MTNNQTLVDIICNTVTSAKNSANKVKQPNFPDSKSQGKPKSSQVLAGQDGTINPGLECQYCKDMDHEKDNYIYLAQILPWVGW